MKAYQLFEIHLLDALEEFELNVPHSTTRRSAPRERLRSCKVNWAEPEEEEERGGGVAA